MLKNLMMITKSPDEVLVVVEKRHLTEEVLRIDLAWSLFLSKKGFNEDGYIDIPQGNPRSKWFALNQWFRQSLGTIVDTMSQDTQFLIALLPPCTPAAYEYVSRMLSIYSTALGCMDLVSTSYSIEEIADQAELFFRGSPAEMVKEVWMPPILRLSEDTSLQKKMVKTQNGSSFTWITGILGSDRLFSQVYQLVPGGSGNRLHSHSDVDEMYVVLKGSGELVTHHGRYPLRS